MKQCPLCNRTYSDDLTYCLEDGALLLAQQDSEATLRYSQRPSPADPTPVSKGRKALWVVLTVVVVALLSALGISLWWQGRADRASAQNINSAPTSVGASPTFSPSPSPKPTPTITPHSSPSPSPSATAVEPAEKSLSPGTYQCEYSYPINEGGVQVARTLKLQFTFNSDGTYTAQGYATIPATGMNDQLYLETKGTYYQSNGLLLFRDRLERKYDLETNSWRPWGVPSDGSKARNKIQNVTPTTFQLDNGPQGAWVTFSKL